MANNNFVFNVSKGMLKYYAGRSGVGGDSLICVGLKLAGLEADETLMDRTTLADVFANGSVELTDASYARQTLTSVLATVDNSVGQNKQNFDAADIVFPTLAGAATGKFIICYKPSGAADSAVIPMTAHVELITPDGTTVTLSVANFADAA